MPPKIKRIIGKEAAASKSKPTRASKSIKTVAAKSTYKGKAKAVAETEPAIKKEAIVVSTSAKPKSGAAKLRTLTEDGAKWLQTNEPPPKDRVAMKERARTHALVLLRTLKQYLIDLEFSFPKNTWQEEIGTHWKQTESVYVDDLLKVKESPLILIGFIGETGAGKSSVINAILGYEGLLPSSISTSCTATITKVSFLRTADPNVNFRAVVEFVTLPEFEIELVQFFGDVKAANEDNPAEDEFDSDERDARMDIMLQRFRAIYPQIAKDDPLKSSVQEMLADESVKRVLTGGSKIIESRDLKSFARKLKPHVGSSLRKMPEERNLNLWPLIR